MKLFLPMLAAGALLCSCAAPKTATLEPTKAAIAGAQVTTKRTQESVAKAQESAAKAQASAKQATQKVADLEKLVAKQEAALTLTQSLHRDIDALTEQLSNTQSALADSQNNVKQTSDWLSQAAERARAAEKEVAKMAAFIAHAKIMETKYHRLKFGVIMIVVAFAGFLSFHFAKFLLPLGMIGIGIMVGGPAALGALLLFVL